MWVNVVLCAGVRLVVEVGLEPGETGLRLLVR